MCRKRSLKEQKESKVRSYKGTLAIAWRKLFLEYGGDPPQERWEREKAALAASHLGGLINEAMPTLARISHEAWEEACAELRL